MDWITDRLARHPDLHVYHSNHYEPTALKRLMCRYGTREHEVDELLRRLVFVDLYTVSAQALRAGVPGYGLEHVERMCPLRAQPGAGGRHGRRAHLRAPARDGRHASAGADRALQRGHCRATLALRDWLLTQRGVAETQFGCMVDALQPA